MTKPLSTDQELDSIEKQLKTKKKPTPPKNDTTGIRHPPKLVFDNGLTPAQEAYCRGRSLGMSKIEALEMAGAVPDSKNKKWDTIPAVQNRIQQLSEMVTENSILKNGLDRGWVISRLMTVTERCMQAEPVLDKDGNPTGEYKFDSGGANRALELLGKTMRMFEGKEKEKTDDYANLSDDEIARIATELAAQTGLAGLIAGAEAPSGSQQVIEVQAIPKAD